MNETIVVKVQTGVERECGFRYENAVYWEVGLSPIGRPLEDFFFDPPVPVPPDLLESTPHIGVHWFQRGGVWHLIDRIGMDNYPNPADIFEETARLGLSRRLPKNLDFSRLTRASRLLLVHDRGLIENFADWSGDEEQVSFICPNNQHAPDQTDICCIGMWWEDLINAEPATDPDAPLRTVTRHMKTFHYQGCHRPAHVEPVYQSAFIASFPATRLAVVQGSESAEILEQVQKAAFLAVEVER